MPEAAGAEARLAALREAYLARCRTRLAEIADYLRLGDDDALAALRRIAHELHGGGGTFGFPAISAAGGELEALFEEMIEGRPVPPGGVEAALDRLRAACA